MEFDFSTYDSSGGLAAIVEAKRRLGTSTEWAAQFRRNILAHARIPLARFFLIVVPDRIYLWDAQTEGNAPPTEIDARAIFAPYFERIGVRPERISPAAFESRVQWWLEDLVENSPTARSSLRDTGVAEAVAGGSVRRGRAA